MPLPSATRLGSYEIIELIGAGGMGEVYRARDLKLQRDVAIKVLPELFAADPDRLARFEREAQSLAALNHPNIAQVYGVLENPAALAMELVDGEDLSQRIARGMLAIDNALPIARQIAEALEAAHERGLVHRDLKPANIKVRPDGAVKVLDFGLARAVTSVEGTGAATITSPAMTQLGVILGTAAYMSPEQARGQVVDRRADIWAFGCVLFEMLTGRRPFAGDDVTTTIASVVKDDPPWNLLPSAVPRAVESLLRRCLVKDPKWRLRDIGEARIALAAPADAAPVVAPRRGGSLALTVAVAAAALAVGALAMWAVGARTRPAPAPPVHALVTIEPAEQVSGGLALSPDGKQIAFVGSRTTGPRSIFVRRLDRDTGYQVNGTENVNISGPTFSPDGRWLAFTVAGLLKKVTVDGSTVMTVASAASNLHTRPAWGPDDTIVFSNEARGLSRVSAAGGTTQVLTRPDIGVSEIAHENPLFLPDGKTLLFNTRKGGSAAGNTSAQIAALTLATGQRHELESGLLLGLVEGNQLMVLREGALFSIPFDRRQVRTAPERVTAVAGVQRARIQAAQVSVPLLAVAANGTIVSVPPRPGEGDVPVVLVDRSGAATRVPLPTHRYSDPKISPDGQKVAVHVFEEGQDNWIADLSRGSFTRLTFDAGEDETPIWSPDGQWVYWTATRKDVVRVIYRKRSDGSGAEQKVWTGDGHTHLGGISPDGKTIVMDMIRGQHIHLAAVNTADGTLTTLLSTPFTNEGPVLSRDGRWLAYASDESGHAEIYVQPFPSMQGRTQVSAGGGSQPVWSRDGRELYYRANGKMMAVAVSTKDDFTAAKPVALFDDQFDTTQVRHTSYDATPDGKFLMLGRPNAGAPTPPYLKVIYRP